MQIDYLEQEYTSQFLSVLTQKFLEIPSHTLDKIHIQFSVCFINIDLLLININYYFSLVSAFSRGFSKIFKSFEPHEIFARSWFEFFVVYT